MLSYRPRPIHLGADAESGEPVRLAWEWLKTHLHILGPPGTGKTRLLLHIFQQLVQRPDATVILMNPKGDLCRLARDVVINGGQTKRLILFDPAEDENVIGYNPLRPNGLSIPTHAKAVREAVRSAWGQDSFDGTAQLARFLFLALCATRELELTLVEAVQVLRAGSTVRARMLARLKNPFVRESLEYFDSLRESRQEELAASTLARLESFILDERVRRILTQQARSLDLGSVIAEREILLVDLQQFKPLRQDDVRLLGRLLINDVVSQVFSRRGPRTPVFLLIDECHIFATQDLCLSLDQGRELGLHCILAHQYPKQLLGEDPSGLLYGSVTDCARTKLVFGGINVANLEEVARELFFCEFDPMKVKDEIESLELEPVESKRVVPTLTVSGSSAISMSNSQTIGRSEMRGTSEGVGQSSTMGIATATAAGATVALNVLGDVVGTGTNQQMGDTMTDAQTESRSSSTQEATTHSRSTQIGMVAAQTGTASLALSVVPFYEYIKRYRVSSRTFESFDEFLIGCMQKLKRQTTGHFVLKTPTSPTVFVRSPFVRTPFVPTRRLASTLARVFARPCYATPLQIEHEESARQAQLLLPGPQAETSRAHAAKIVRYKRNKAPSEA